MPYLVEELMEKDRMELKTIRAKLFLRNKFRGKSHEFHEALLDFCQMFTIIQDLRDWRGLSEPGIAGLMVGDDDVDDVSLEQAREIDRNSIETHDEIAAEFEELGGKKEFQRRIDRLNQIAQNEGVEPSADRAYYDREDFDQEDLDDDWDEDEGEGEGEGSEIEW